MDEFRKSIGPGDDAVQSNFFEVARSILQITLLLTCIAFAIAAGLTGKRYTAIISGTCFGTVYLIDLAGIFYCCLRIRFKRGRITGREIFQTKSNRTKEFLTAVVMFGMWPMFILAAAAHNGALLIAALFPWLITVAAQLLEFFILTLVGGFNGRRTFFGFRYESRSQYDR